MGQEILTGAETAPCCCEEIYGYVWYPWGGKVGDDLATLFNQLDEDEGGGGGGHGLAISESERWLLLR